MKLIEKAILLVIIFISGCTQKAKKPADPNFVFILVDDLGYYDLSYQGSSLYQTPAIDSLANSGMIFTNGYAACQVCSPSRATIMTGQFPDRHGITDYIGAPMGEEWNNPHWGEARGTKLLPAHYRTHLPHEHTTLAEALKSAGYKTFFAGKWHLGSEGSYPEDHGFEINKGGYEAGGPYSGGYFDPFNNPKMKDRNPGESLTLRLARETADFIRNNQEEKFLAYLAFYAVHAPLQTSRERWEKYRDIIVSEGIADSGYAMEKRMPIRIVQDNPVYAGMVETVDEGVGIVADALRETGLDKETVIIFTSDNGGVSSGDDFATSLLPMRGGKGYHWEGGIRVPYIICVPWLENNGLENDTPVSGADFYPTILDIAGLELIPDQHLDGISLKPLLMGEEFKGRPIFWHYPHYGNQGGDPSSIIRFGEWKLIYYHETRSSELYNMIQDPNEQYNLASVYPDVAESMEIALLERLKMSDAKFPTENPEFDPGKLAAKIKKRETETKKWLEEQRMKKLDENWEPNESWWGSIKKQDRN